MVSIEHAVELLAQGDVCAIPTETVYGLAADANHSDAVAKIYRTKQRPSGHPLIVHIPHADNAATLQSHVTAFATDIPDYVWQLTDAFWPGPLTLILPKRAGVAQAATAEQTTIGLRCPDHVIAQRLLTLCKERDVDGLAAPSANPFGKLSPTTAAHVQHHFGDSVAVLDGGACTRGVESTIALCLPNAMRVLRPGSITVDALQHAIPRIACARHSVDNDGANMDSHTPLPSTPGSMKSHYQPNAQVRIMPTKAMQDAIQILGADAKNIGIYSRTPFDRLSKNMPRLAMPHTPAEAEQALYADLHTLDDMGLKLIWVEMLPNGAEWDALRDRLDKAAA